MAIRRVAVIYDDRARPDTTGVYCRRALEALVETGHPARRAGGHTARGVRPLSQHRRRIELPSAGGAPSAPGGPLIRISVPSGALEKGRHFDVVFAAQRDGAELLRKSGIASARWLPLACNPEIHRKHEVARQYDIAFVGNLFPGPRTELLNLGRRRYPRVFIGNAYFEDMARAYSEARTAFNRSIRNDVNMRVFEAVACGSLLLTNDLTDNGQAELFQDGVHLATYRSPKTCSTSWRSTWIGEGPRADRRRRPGRSDREDTYRHRIERVLREVEAALGRVTVGGLLGEWAPRSLST